MVGYETTSKLFFPINPLGYSYKCHKQPQSLYQNNTLRQKSTKTLMSPRYSIVTSSNRGHDYMICITQSQIHLFNQHKVLQRVPQSCYRRVKTKMCANPYAQVHGRNPQVGHPNIHQEAHDIPLSPQISTCKTYIKCSQILKDSIRYDNFKGKTQSITREQRGEKHHKIQL